MDQAGIIRDLLNWLESHLDQPLSLDNVAAKAGYSKWHLQRMFKDVTGHAIGSYIRARRLTKAAVALCLTSRPILDIALQYRFDSQQTFTRAFKKQFAQTPASYRRSDNWNTFGIRPPIRLGAFTLPQPQFITLPETQLLGLTQTYNCRLEQICNFRTEIRVHYWRQFLERPAPFLPYFTGCIIHGRVKRKTTNTKCSTPPRWSHSICPMTSTLASPSRYRAATTRCLFLKGQMTSYRILLSACMTPVCRPSSLRAAKGLMPSVFTPAAIQMGKYPQSSAASI